MTLISQTSVDELLCVLTRRIPGSTFGLEFTRRLPVGRVIYRRTIGNFFPDSKLTDPSVSIKGRPNFEFDIAVWLTHGLPPSTGKEIVA